MPILILEDPIGFLILYFLFVTQTQGPQTLLLLSLITSTLLYPFIYIGKYLMKKWRVEEREKWKDELKTFIVVSIIFWVIIRAWYFLQGNTFTESVPKMFIWMLFSGLLTYGIYRAIKPLYQKLTNKWEMPSPIALFVMNYIVNLLGWIVLYLLIIVI